MQFAIALLVLLAAACALSSLVTQGQSYTWYAARYSERMAAIILALQLDDAYHSWWFLLLNSFLVLNLILCNGKSLPGLLKQYREMGELPAQRPGVEREGITEPEAVFRAMGMPHPRRGVSAEGKEVLYAHRNRVGIWGAWVCHLGILLLILGFSLGQMTKEEYVVYGVPGQLRRVGDTNLVVGIDDFRVELREDDTVEQYTAEITVYDLTREGDPGESAGISVNHPATLHGMRFYQNSTGWAARVQITKAGEPLQDTVLCAGEYLPVEDMPQLVVYFNAFYPDYVLIKGQGPATQSGKLNNPGYLYSVYYQGEILGMNVLTGEDTLTIDDYEVVFSEPQSYTLIQAKRDNYTWLALAGGLVTTLGLILAFYLQPRRLWAIREGERWRLCGLSRKGGVLFAEELDVAIKSTEKGELPHAES